MSERGKGWKRDLQEFVNATEKESAVSSLDKFGAARLPKDVNLIGKHCLVRDQANTSACVGFGFTGAAYARLHYLGIPCAPFSPQGFYTGTRQLERAGHLDTIPMEDGGSYPFLALMFGSRFGFMPETSLPFNPSTINSELNFLQFTKASQFRVANFKRIEVMRRHLVMTALAKGRPVTLGMMVGNDFANYRKGLGPIGVETTNLGGHETFLVGYRDDGNIFIGCNSWSKDYGDEGFYEIHVSKLEDPSTSDIVDFVITDATAPEGSLAGARFQATIEMAQKAIAKANGEE